MRRKAHALIVFGWITATSATSSAAGLFVADRGVRPLGRGGAWVAGADDLGAIWYNPAGLADAGSTLFVDLSWLNFTSEYRRQMQVTDASGAVRVYDYPRVNGTTPFIPIPTIGGTYNFGKRKEFTAALGVLAPYTAIASYPLSVNGQPSPQRYSLVNMDGSALAIAGGYFAYKPVEQFRVGGGVQAMVGKFASKVVFSASPADRVISAPEDPQYDALSQLEVGPIISPSGNFGITVVPDKRLHLGVSAQLPFWVNAPATVRVRLPTAAPFDKARQEGDEARVRFRLPPIVRAGAEYRAYLGDESELRIELAYVREFWSLHDSIDVRSENIKLYDISAFPSPFGVTPISLPRKFQDSSSFRGGFEYMTNAIFKHNRTDLRAGLSYETSGIPPQWVSALTYDASKIIGSAGAGIHLGNHWRMDAVFSLVLMDGTQVSPAEAQIPRVNPVKGNPTKPEAFYGGEFSARAIILGAGAQYTF